MPDKIILIGHFFAASLLTFVLASLTHSQFVLDGLIQLGIAIPFGDRLAMSWQDLQGLFPSLGGAISFSLLLAFLCVYGLSRWQQAIAPRLMLLYPLAGALAIWLMLTAMQPIMHITLIAGARSAAGVLSLSLCGAAGGWLFWYLRSGYIQSSSGVTR